MRIYFKIFFVSFPLFLTCCSSKEVKIEYYGDGTIKSKTEISNGVKNGYQYFYYPNGKIQQIDSFRNDSIFGTSSYFQKNGYLSKRTTHTAIQKDGPYEIYYSNGNIAEAGNFIANNKRGKILQYFESDSGKVKWEFYALDSARFSFSYYSKRFDEKGNLLEFNQPIKIFFPDNGFTIGEESFVKVRLLHQYNYDSASIIIGDFDDPKFPFNSLDSAEFMDNETKVIFMPQKKGKQMFRGKYVIYRKEEDADSTIEYTTYGYFEEPIIVE